MALGIGALISGGAQLLGGIFGMASARAKEREAAEKAERLNKKLQSLEENRQAITNPYENVEDLSDMLSNPMANLAVSTQAAKMQVEQADISLANTLDTIRATGASAGGATALAQAALQSKKGVSASIEKQEVDNERLKAQGESNLQRAQMAEKQRVQNARVSGELDVFAKTEVRENQQLNRVSSQLAGAQQQEAQAQADFSGALTGTISGLAGTAASYMNAEASRNNLDKDGYKTAAKQGRDTMFNDSNNDGTMVSRFLSNQRANTDLSDTAGYDTSTGQINTAGLAVGNNANSVYDDIMDEGIDDDDDEYMNPYEYDDKNQGN